MTPGFKKFWRGLSGENCNDLLDMKVSVNIMLCSRSWTRAN